MLGLSWGTRDISSWFHRGARGSLSSCGAQAPERVASVVKASRLTFSVARGDPGSLTSDQTLHWKVGS